MSHLRLRRFQSASGLLSALWLLCYVSDGHAQTATPSATGGVPAPTCSSSDHTCTVTIQAGSPPAPSSTTVTQVSSGAAVFSLTATNNAAIINE